MSDAKNISYQPTAGLSYDPSEARYWDHAALAGELERVFEVCHGCRMCFKYCDTFPILFERIDGPYEGDVRRLTDADKTAVMDACFQCKLCEVQCPYTPRDNHPFQLDFPKLVHRYKAVRARERGITLRERALGDPDATARFARASFGVANVMNRVGIHRAFMEKLLGIHRDKLLPDFALWTFDRRATEHGRLSRDAGGEVVLFPTCYVQHNEPQIGIDTLEVLDHNGVDSRCVAGLKCCGMPAWEHGDLDTLRANARNNLDILMPYVDAGAKVIALNPTCAMMMRRDYPELLEGDDRERAKKLAAAVMDPGEFLWTIRNEPRFNTAFKSTPGKIAYHTPCHLRAQGVGFKGRDLLRKIPGAAPTTVMECCGHNGTYAMTIEGFEPSRRVGKKAFDGVQGAEADTWVTDCPLAALQFAQHAGRKPIHPMTALARAYRADGFAQAIEKPQDDEKKE